VILNDRKRRSSAELSDELVRQITVLRQHSQHVSMLETRIAAYEQQFNIPSSLIHEAINDGRLTETSEVCDWIMDVELLERARHRPAAQ